MNPIIHRALFELQKAVRVYEKLESLADGDTKIIMKSHANECRKVADELELSFSQKKQAKKLVVDDNADKEKA